MAKVGDTLLYIQVNNTEHTVKIFCFLQTKSFPE